MYNICDISNFNTLKRARYDISKQVRRADKKIKDALSQADEERRQHDALKEQVNHKYIYFFYCNFLA